MPADDQKEMRLRDYAARVLARGAAEQAVEFEGRWYSWGDMRRVADRVAGLVAASGAHPEAAVGLVPRNRPSAIAAFLALIGLGRTVRMIYAFQSPKGVARDIQRLGPAVLLAAEEDLTEDVRIALNTAGSAAIALKEMGAEALPGFEQADETLARPAGGEPRIEILTSGTTGAPKPFAVTHALIAKHYMASAAALPGTPGAGQGPPNLLYFPLSNISGIYTVLPALLSGKPAVLLDRFTVKDWHEYVLRYRPANSGSPAASVQMILDADIPAEDLASIKTFGTGAAPLDPTVQRAFEERYGIPILLSYGATEFGGPVTAMTPQLYAEWGTRKFGSVGRALPGAKLRTVDPDSGSPLPPGKEGLLEVVSPRMGPDWIRTSDIGMVDEDGFIFLRGRADGAIMRGGFKVLPETIEHALLLHPAVSAAAVVALPDRRLGQVPGAAIQLKPGAQADSDELEAHLRDHVLKTHIPEAWKFVDELPKTSSVKVDRPAVRALFAQAEDG
jgi:acyl-coenzyme A synthetase/AMP-(fatty) acid ligase